MTDSTAGKSTLDSLCLAIERGENGDALRQAEEIARRLGGLRGFAEFLAEIHPGEDPIEPRTRADIATRAAEILLKDLDDEEGAKAALFRAADVLLDAAAGEEAAFELLHRIFEIDPSYPPMLRAVADYHRADGEPGEAWRFYTRYLEAAPGARDSGVVQLRLAQIAMGYEEVEQARTRFLAALEGALPEDEVPIARILGRRLIDRHPDDAEVAEAARIFELMESDPNRLERDLHREAARASGAERARISRRLGRLREVRLGAPEAAAVAYRDVLSSSPQDIDALSGLERVLANAPAAILRLACTALDATDDINVRRQLHSVAARAAGRAGDTAAQGEHRLLAFRTAPEDPALRRLAAHRLRRDERWIDLIEVLRAEATWGHRLAALAEGAEVIAEKLGHREAAVPWAEEALGVANESGRPDEARRIRELLERLGRPVAAPPEAEPEHAEPAATEPARAVADAAPARAPVQEAPAPAAAPVDAAPAKSPPPAVEPEAEPDGEEEVPPPEDFSGSDENRRIAEAALVRGRVLDAQGKLEAAIEAYVQAVEARPRHAEALRLLAFVYEQAGRNQEAVSCLERLLYLVTDVGEKARLRIRRASLIGDPAFAAADLQEAVQIGEKDRDILDLVSATATHLQLWDLRALARERKRALGEAAKPSLFKKMGPLVPKTEAAKNA